MRTALAALGVASLLLVAGCGGDGDEDGTSTTTTEEPAGPTVPPEDASHPVRVEGCEETIEAAAPEQAAESFPDHPDVTWTVGEASVTEVGLGTVELTPSSDEVGYPAFRLVAVCEGERSVLVGVYAREGDGWVLLFTTDERPEIELPATAS
mgnify:CR=1 FL=1